MSIKLAFALILGTVVSGSLAAAEKPGLRVITYNILAAKGYPQTDGNAEYLKRAKPQMPTRITQELALYDPDIVTFQESPKEEVVAEMAEQLGMEYRYFEGGFPGTLLTKHKILEHENAPVAEGERPKDLFTRHWGRAVLEIDGERLHIFTAHMHPSRHELRERETTEMLKVMKPAIESGESVIFLGDLNHDPDEDTYQRWKKAGLTDTFLKKGQGIPLTFTGHEPRKRIDYIWAAGPIAQRTHHSRVLHEGPFRTYSEDPRPIALSDHMPVLTDFK